MGDNKVKLSPGINPDHLVEHQGSDFFFLNI